MKRIFIGLKWKGRQPATPTILLFLSLVLGSPLTHADSGTDGAAFLNIPVGAGPAALGSAYSALADNAYAPVWNPVGLGFLESTEIAGQHLMYLESMNYEFASFAHPLWKSRLCGPDEFCGGTGLGAAVQYLGAGSITGRDTGGNLTGDFSAHYAAGTLGYGKAVTEHVAVGLAGKVIQGKLDDVTANAYAADFGVMAKPTNRLTLATVVTNVGSKMTFLNQSDPLPLGVHASAAYRLTSWMFSAEGVYQRTGLNSGHVGIEWRPLPIVALRTGYRTDTLKSLSPIAGLSTGIGLDLWGQEFAYAWMPYGDLGNTQYFSLLIRWGEVDRRQRNLIYFHSIKKDRLAGEMDPNSPEFQQLMQMITYSDQRVASIELRPQDLNTGSESATLVTAPPTSDFPSAQAVVTEHTPWVPQDLQGKR